jgi:glyoxylase-like metal-dependent hydrolase (beta-lactamase superfamily II)
MTIEVTGIEEQRAWTERRLPDPERLRDRVWSIAIPCPPFAIRFTYCYVLAGDDGRLVIVDPGWDSPEGREVLLRALQAEGLSLEDLDGVVITHAHADHIIMARWLVDETGAWAGMHARESEVVEKSREATPETLLAREHDWLVRTGAPDDVRDRFYRTADLRRYAPNTRATRDLADGDLLPLSGRRVEVLWTPGHTPGHLCLVDHDAGAVLTGDHVLPWISPNVGLTSSASPDRDAIGEYDRSLERMTELGDLEAFPAHQFRFRGLAGRARELLAHQDARQREVEGVLAATPGATVWDVAERLTWSRPWESLDDNNLRAALAETMAHLRHAGRPV